MRFWKKLSVSPFFVPYLAAASLLLPPKNCAALLLAATLHECGHLLCLLLFRIPVIQLRFSPGGAVIRTNSAALSYPREAFLYLCGPAANLCALMLSLFFHSSFFWLLFAANLICACYNLLPIPPLDGSGALLCLLSARFPEHRARRILRRIGNGCSAVLLLLGAWLLHTSLHAAPGATLGPLSLFGGALGLFFLGIMQSGTKLHTKSTAREKKRIQEENRGFHRKTNTKRS